MKASLESAPQALVCDIQRFSVHDGPGIRTTIFFKGCPLDCRWCHNPETKAYKNQLVFSLGDCIACGDCVPACPQGALMLGRDQVAIDFNKCDGCMLCADLCPSEALAPAARPYTSDMLLTEVLQDCDFFGESGGITLSGGEPLIHVDFLRDFLPKAKGKGLNIVAETTGYWPFERLGPVLGLVDLYLFDLKLAESARHIDFTGKPNELIVENLCRLVQEGHKVQVRMPLVPGCNDDGENISSTATALRSLGLGSITLLPYHSLGQSKAMKIGVPIPALELCPPNADDIESAIEIFDSNGIEAACQAG